MICEKCGKEILKNELASLPKRQIVALLEKAVMDGRLKDTKLFQYEGMGTLDHTAMEVLRTYFYGFEFKKAKGELEIRNSKRLLRVMKNKT